VFKVRGRPCVCNSRAAPDAQLVLGNVIWHNRELCHWHYSLRRNDGGEADPYGCDGAIGTGGAAGASGSLGLLAPPGDGQRGCRAERRLTRAGIDLDRSGPPNVLARGGGRSAAQLPPGPGAVSAPLGGGGEPIAPS
jgi:hypothetical protein